MDGAVRSVRYEQLGFGCRRAESYQTAVEAPSCAPPDLAQRAPLMQSTVEVGQLRNDMSSNRRLHPRQQHRRGPKTKPLLRGQGATLRGALVGVEDLDGEK